VRTVVRAPPATRQTLASAHDVAPEHRILTALSAAARACPVPLASARSIGHRAPFYLMDHWTDLS